MPQFILIAHDATDEGAKGRRADARNEHLRLIAKLRDNGNMICGVALTDDKEEMNGSLIVANFATREEFDAWLASDPYTINKVWDKTQVLTGKLAPTFQDLISKAPLR